MNTVKQTGWIQEKLDDMNASNWQAIKQELQKELLFDSVTIWVRLMLIIRVLKKPKMVMILPLYLERQSQREMAKELRCSPSTINDLLKKLRSIEDLPMITAEGVDPDFAAKIYKRNGHLEVANRRT